MILAIQETLNISNIAKGWFEVLLKVSNLTSDEVREAVDLFYDRYANINIINRTNTSTPIPSSPAALPLIPDGQYIEYVPEEKRFIFQNYHIHYGMFSSHDTFQYCTFLRVGMSGPTLINSVADSSYLYDVNVKSEIYDSGIWPTLHPLSKLHATDMLGGYYDQVEFITSRTMTPETVTRKCYVHTNSHIWEGVHYGMYSDQTSVFHAGKFYGGKLLYAYVYGGSYTGVRLIRSHVYKAILNRCVVKKYSTIFDGVVAANGVIKINTTVLGGIYTNIYFRRATLRTARLVDNGHTVLAESTISPISPGVYWVDEKTGERLREVQ
jgi:hypothetical protein